MERDGLLDCDWITREQVPFEKEMGLFDDYRKQFVLKAVE